MYKKDKFTKIMTNYCDVCSDPIERGRELFLSQNEQHTAKVLDVKCLGRLQRYSHIERTIKTWETNLEWLRKVRDASFTSRKLRAT